MYNGTCRRFAVDAAAAEAIAADAANAAAGKPTVNSEGEKIDQIPPVADTEEMSEVVNADDYLPPQLNMGGRTFTKKQIQEIKDRYTIGNVRMPGQLSPRVTAAMALIKEMDMVEIAELVEEMAGSADVSQYELGLLADSNALLRLRKAGHMVNYSGGGVAGGGGGGGGDGGGGGEEAAVKAESTAFNVKLTAFDASAKIKMIKEVRGLTGLGLKQAKELVESAPCVVGENLSKADADKMEESLKAAGGEVELEGL